MPVYDSFSEQHTAAIAENTARLARSGTVFLLNGPLGAGKSAFARAFIRTLCGHQTEVPSPTYTLVQTYDSPKGPIWHFDLYRLKNPDDLFELGWEDARSGIALVEWPERAQSYMPSDGIQITLIPTGETARKIEIDD